MRATTWMVLAGLAGPLSWSPEAGAVTCSDFGCSDSSSSNGDPYTIYEDDDDDQYPGHTVDKNCLCTVNPQNTNLDHVHIAASPSDWDCNDQKDDVHPGATEACDGKDNDCDGEFNEGCDTSDYVYWCPDPDGDGYYNGETYRGESTSSSLAGCYQSFTRTCGSADVVGLTGQISETCCAAIPSDFDIDPGWSLARDEGWARLAGDCYEAPDCAEPNTIQHAAVNTSRTELCADTIDNDCNGGVDDWVTDPDQCALSAGVRLSVDNDGDGYGNAHASESGDVRCGCVESVEEVQCSDDDNAWCLNTDCNDEVAAIHPLADESEDGADTNCDGYIPIIELDCDGDSWLPAVESPLASCAQSDVLDLTCPELHDYVDLRTCRGGQWEYRFTVDTLWGDDGGPFRYSIRRSMQAEYGTSRAGSDCDDLNAARSPDAEEVCDGLDNDCWPMPVLPIDADADGVPDAMQGGASRMIVHIDEADLDNDGALRCTESEDLSLNDDNDSNSVQISGRTQPLALGDANDLCALVGPVDSGESTDDLWCNGLDDITGTVELEDVDFVEGDPRGDAHVACGPGRSASLNESEESIYVLFYLPDASEPPIPLLLPMPTCDGTETQGCVLRASSSDESDVGAVYSAGLVEENLANLLTPLFRSGSDCADLLARALPTNATEASDRTNAFTDCALTLCGVNLTDDTLAVDSTEAEDSDDREDPTEPLLCSVAEVRLKMSEAEGVDRSLDFIKVHWPQSRILASRYLVSRWELARYKTALSVQDSEGDYAPGGYGSPPSVASFNADQRETGTTWRALFAPTFITLRNLDDDERWGARSYTPTGSNRLLAACWNDPELSLTSSPTLEDVFPEVGGDCDPDNAAAHRDAYEGWVEGWPGNNCDTCNDCLDNDCDGQTDLGTGEPYTMDEGCLECLNRGVPMSRGCGQDRCDRQSCGLSRAPDARLALLVLWALALRRRRA